MVHAELTQKPVGQGGFLAGVLTTDRPRFRWVFDCGSNQSDSLRREVQRFSGHHIDLAFMSHLDMDHVNGFDLLLTHCAVGEVVLPYLNAQERLLQIAVALEDGQLSGQLLDFHINPYAWFRQRGVGTITLIDGPNESDPPIFPADPIDPGDGPLRHKWSSSRTAAPQDGATQKITNGDIAQIASTNGFIDWIFMPQVHRPSARRAAAFGKALRAAFNERGLTPILRAARTSEGRAVLRTCYDSLWRDHNRISMSLYAGPTPFFADQWIGTTTHSIDDHRTKHHRHSGLGWLVTGDADLAAPRRRADFIKYFQPILPNVGVLGVPHHGAASSFDERILQGMTSLKVGAASAGQNGYGHPHKIVRDAIEHQAGRSFAHVSESVRSELRSQLRFRP